MRTLLPTLGKEFWQNRSQIMIAITVLHQRLMGNFVKNKLTISAIRLADTLRSLTIEPPVTCDCRVLVDVMDTGVINEDTFDCRSIRPEVTMAA